MDSWLTEAEQLKRDGLEVTLHDGTVRHYKVVFYMAADRKWVRMWMGLCQERCNNSCDYCELDDCKQKSDINW